MEVIAEKGAMREWSRRARRAGHRLALVPTMGALHAGHLSLVAEARARAQRVVLSIYVNPSQFGPAEDFSTYPRTLSDDLAKLQPLGVDAVFVPSNLYHSDDSNEGHETWVRVERLERPLCGQNRPGFFRGVATVVAKFFNIVEPDVAVFGRKDFQQFRLICRMVRDLDFDVEVVGAPLVREADGLAMSSRNVGLSADDRQRALSINRALKAAHEAFSKGERDPGVLTQRVADAIVEAGGFVFYVEVLEQESLGRVERIHHPVVLAVAARFGQVRLLDNIEIQA